MKTCNKDLQNEYIDYIFVLEVIFMDNIRVGCIPVRQALEVDNKRIKIKNFIKNNKVGLIIGGVSIALLSVYAILIINFINLIKVIYQIKK